MLAHHGTFSPPSIMNTAHLASATLGQRSNTPLSPNPLTYMCRPSHCQLQSFSPRQPCAGMNSPPHFYFPSCRFECPTGLYRPSPAGCANQSDSAFEVQNQDTPRQNSSGSITSCLHLCGGQHFSPSCRSGGKYPWNGTNQSVQSEHQPSPLPPAGGLAGQPLSPSTVSHYPCACSPIQSGKNFPSHSATQPQQRSLPAEQSLYTQFQGSGVTPHAQPSPDLETSREEESGTNHLLEDRFRFRPELQKDYEVDLANRPESLATAISMYIDFLVWENECQTNISKCNLLDVDFNIEEEFYYQEVMSTQVPFPTEKFRKWLKLYGVDIEITDMYGNAAPHTTFSPIVNLQDLQQHNQPFVLHWQLSETSSPVAKVKPAFKTKAHKGVTEKSQSVTYSKNNPREQGTPAAVSTSKKAAHEPAAGPPTPLSGSKQGHDSNTARNSPKGNKSSPQMHQEKEATESESPAPPTKDSSLQDSDGAYKALITPSNRCPDGDTSVTSCSVSKPSLVGESGDMADMQGSGGNSGNGLPITVSTASVTCTNPRKRPHEVSSSNTDEVKSIVKCTRHEEPL